MMHWIDWLIVLVPLIVILYVVKRTASYSKSVSTFISAGRCAGRYLICNARGEAGYGAVSAVAVYQAIYVAGLTYFWWSNLSGIFMVVIGLSGFVFYRYRETRVMTLAQFFEVRYSKRLRIFTGWIGFLSGIVNYGIFPGVSARFITHLCGLPESLVFGSFTVPTYIIMMVLGLSYALYVSMSGGQVTIMISDCIMGIMAGIFYLIICITLLYFIQWDQISYALSNQPVGKSLINPFDSSSLKDFNLVYILIGILLSIYWTNAWQGGHAYNSSAESAHEAKMANVLGGFRNISTLFFTMVLGICGYTFLNHPDFAVGAEAVRQKLSLIAGDQNQSQMRVPLALVEILPIGIRGLLCLVMLSAWIAVDGSYLHSWGTIFVQDMILPGRKKSFTPKQHLSWLRWSIFGVAVFGFLFSIFFIQTDYILMFFSLTGAIFLGGAGSLIIGGLYWKKGTTIGAWFAMILGSSLSVGSILYKQFHPDFPVNGQILSLISCGIGVMAYVIISLLTCKKDFNMDRMLHRGEYRTEGVDLQAQETWKAKILGMIGINEEYTKSDKILSYGIFAWSMLWFIVFIIVSTWNLISPWPLAWWSTYWHIAVIVLPFAVGLVVNIAISVGGMKDMKRYFKKIEELDINVQDDGTVVHHHNRGEVDPRAKDLQK